MRPQAEGHRTGAVHQRVKASSTSGVLTCRASGYAHPTQPHHPSIVVAAPCAGQQGTCIQLPEDVFLQALVHKDVGRHKARPLQLLVIEKNDYRELPQSVLAPLAQTGVMDKSTPSGLNLICKYSMLTFSLCEPTSLMMRIKDASQPLRG